MGWILSWWEYGLYLTVAFNPGVGPRGEVEVGEVEVGEVGSGFGRLGLGRPHHTSPSLKCVRVPTNNHREPHLPVRLPEINPLARDFTSLVIMRLFLPLRFS